MPETTSRILYVDPAKDAPEAAFAEAARLGFSHVLLPPPWPASAAGDRLAPSALDAPAFGAWIQAAQAAGLAVLLDLQVNRLAAGCGVRLGGGLFHATNPRAAMDPRQAVDADADTAFVESDADAHALGAFWARHLTRWTAAGLAGVRLLGLDATPPASLGAFLTAMSEGAPDAALLAWAPGMSRDGMAALAGHGLAGVFSSFPWWDYRAPWFWDELAILRLAAPVLHAPEAPGGARWDAAVQDPASAPAIYRRAATLAASLGQGWLAAYGAAWAPGAGEDMAGFVRGLNAMMAGDAALRGAGAAFLPAGVGGPVLAVLRTDTPDRRTAQSATMAVVNTDARHRQTIDPSVLLTPLGGRFAKLEQRLPVARSIELSPIVLAPGESAVFVAEATVRPAPAIHVDQASAQAGAARPRLAIEAISPAVDDGAFPVKRVAGEAVVVTADLLFDGHDKIAGALRYRGPDGSGGFTEWRETRLRPLGNDRWQAEFPLILLGRHEYVVVTWRDLFETFRDEIAKKHAAGVDVTLELQEGVALVARFAKTAGSEAGPQLRTIAAGLEKADTAARREILLSAPVARLMAAADPRTFAVESAVMPVDAERLEARFASWYEVFPRSLSDDPNRHGNFDDVIRHLPRVAAMGFDVLYFPPIHPIGRKNRKGRNNTLTPAPEDPGSPYAIGNEQGGHDALHPELGDFDDFRRLREAAAAHGLELAIDFAIQCAPDHPWLREHPGWFDWRPDGSIKYAENPPKKYEDIVNVDFYAEDAVPALWLELCRAVLFWASQGVRLFRVDNPHTKPFPFWEWMIREVRQRYPDAVFLAEAFTRPKIMYRLAKIGFSQSYTYFTWRNTKKELAAYSTELAEEAPRDFFRPHFFVNTPDINPLFLHNSGRPGFLIRAALASTLSGLWGVYNGFELCEGTPMAAGREEYLDSEKYQLRAWDWDRAGNIVAEITALNRLRRENPALQSHLNVRFHTAHNDMVLYYEKSTFDRSNVLLIAVSLDPAGVQEADFEVPLWEWGHRDDGTVEAADLLSGQAVTWHGKMQHVRLTPDRPYAIWRVTAGALV